MKIDRLRFLSLAAQQEGKPYIWGAKGPDRYDCSGLITWCIKQCGGPNWRGTHNADTLYTVLERVPLAPDADLFRLPAGILVFYGTPARASHVMIAWGDGRVFGACGGDEETTSPDPKAFVQFRSKVHYRPGFLGCRKLP